MATWSDFHPNPRKSYYLFLRQGYGCPAHVAHARVKQFDAMIMRLDDRSREARAISWLAAVVYSMSAAGRARKSLRRMWESMTGPRALGSPKRGSRLSSRFPQVG